MNIPDDDIAFISTDWNRGHTTIIVGKGKFVLVDRDLFVDIMNEAYPNLTIVGI